MVPLACPRGFWRGLELEPSMRLPFSHFPFHLSHPSNPIYQPFIVFFPICHFFFFLLIWASDEPSRPPSSSWSENEERREELFLPCFFHFKCHSFLSFEGKKSGEQKPVNSSILGPLPFSHFRPHNRISKVSKERRVEFSTPPSFASRPFVYTGITFWVFLHLPALPVCPTPTLSTLTLPVPPSLCNLVLPIFPCIDCAYINKKSAPSSPAWWFVCVCVCLWLFTYRCTMANPAYFGWLLYGAFPVPGLLCTESQMRKTQSLVSGHASWKEKKRRKGFLGMKDEEMKAHTPLLALILYTKKKTKKKGEMECVHVHKRTTDGRTDE